MCVIPCAEGVLERLRKLFKMKKKSRTKPIIEAEEYDRDNVDFLPPIMIEEKVTHTVSDPGVKEINADSLIHKNVESIITMKKVSSLALV